MGNGMYMDQRDHHWVNRQILLHFLAMYDDLYDSKPDGLKLKYLIDVAKENPPNACFAKDVDVLVKDMGETAFRSLFPCEGDYMVIA